jgi:hypothetical protein
MRSKTEWCPECLARAEAFLVPEKQDARCVEHVRFRDDEKLEGYVLARDTSAELEPKATFRQKPWHGERVVVWKPDHRLRVEVSTWDRWSDDKPPVRIYEKHLRVENRDAKRGHGELLCKLPETFKLVGPGAQDHIEADAPKVAALNGKVDLKARTKERERAASAEAEAYGQQLVSVLKTLGIEATSSGSAGGFLYSDDQPRKPEDFRVSVSLKVAARVAEALGGTVARPPTEPMPLWKVWYGETKEEDKEPLYVAARTRQAVIVHMTGKYCHERRPGDEPNVPLKPELLTIEEAGPDPEVPAEESDENAA